MTKFVKLYQQIFHEVVQSHLQKTKIYYCQIRLISSKAKEVPIEGKQKSNEAKQLFKEELDLVNYTKRDNDFKATRAATIRKLVGLLGIEEFEAIDIALRHKQLCETTGVQLKDNYRTCLDSGLKKNIIEKCIDVLAIKDLPTRVSYLPKLGKVNDVAPLLRLPPGKLWKLEKDFTRNSNSIYYLADLLNVPPFEISEEFVRKPFLHRMSFTKISQVVQLLSSNGITGAMIANDLTTFKYSIKTIEDRIAFAKELKVPEFKTWMIRVDKKIFHNYIKIRSENKEILGDNGSIAEYLSERLDCSVVTANYLLNKLPALNNKSVKKTSEIIDYLYAQGYTPGHICRVPKILLHSFETTKKRMKKLAAIGVEVNSLYVLIKSQKAFQEFYDNLIKSLNKRKKNLDTQILLK